MITGVALRNNITGQVVSLDKPNRHNHVISKIVQDKIDGRVTSQTWTQGFVTSDGTFLDRQEAGFYAFKEKQTEVYRDILFSEDLW